MKFFIELGLSWRWLTHRFTVTVEFSQIIEFMRESSRNGDATHFNLSLITKTRDCLLTCAGLVAEKLIVHVEAFYLFTLLC